MLKLFALILLVLPSVTLASKFQLEQVAPGIYVHHGKHLDINAGYGGDICNISFVIGSKGVAVIDTGGSPKVGAQLHDAIRRITKLPITHVINTHVHPDHSLGNAAFKQDRPIFVGHSKLANIMAQRKDAYLRNQVEWVGADAQDTELIPPTLAVSDTLEIDLGGRMLHLTAHPVAHSPSDLSVYDATSNTLWTGDLLFIERTPSIDGDIKSWLSIIDQLRATHAAHTIPGHGPVTAKLGLALDDEKRYLNTLLADVRTAIKQGRNMEETIGIAATSERGNWVLFDVINRRNVALLFPMLEWE